MEHKMRSEGYRRFAEVEKTLDKLRSIIRDPALEHFEDTANLPIFFIVGVARSGSTILSQFLSTIKQLHYPSNLLSRFYYAPYVGSLLQKLFVDYDYKSELLNHEDYLPKFSSDLGKTVGPLSPHEFWYFWRRFFEHGETQNVLLKQDFKGFFDGLSSIQSVFPKPLFLKGMIFNWHLDQLYNWNKNSYFIFIKRDPYYNAQSLLLTRKKFFNDISKWYSFKPQEYGDLILKNPYEQVAGQVFYTNRSIEKCLYKIPAKNKIFINYEEFCDDTSIVLNYLNSVMLSSDLEEISNTKYKTFDTANTIKLNQKDQSRLLSAINKYYL